MTRKQALEEAIKYLEKDKDNSIVILKLRDIIEELPASHWTEKSIIDAIEQYAYDHNNNLPSVAGLTFTNNLPSNTVIKRIFKISSIDTFFKKYFSHLNEQNKSSSPYRFEKDSYFLDIFKKNYLRIRDELKLKVVDSITYNKYKEKNTPHTTTIIKRCNCKTYNELLILCEYKKKPASLKTNINISYNDNEDRNLEFEKILLEIK